MPKFKLETHTYAPELNRIIFPNGATLPAANLHTIKEAKDFWFRPKAAAKLVVITATNAAGQRIVARGTWPKAGWNFIGKIIEADRNGKANGLLTAYDVKTRLVGA